MYRYTFVLSSSIILLSLVSADRNNIIGDRSVESWISKTNFSTLVEVSFNVSMCCNVYVSGESTVTENLFKEFVRIYQFEYVVMNRTYDCAGYFMICTSVDRLVHDMSIVPTMISDTEILIIVEDDVKDPTRLLNVTMYENANVNIATHNGLWTLSENFLRPRKFKKVSRPEDMVHKSGFVNFQGRELQAAAFYLTPFCYLQRTVNRTVNGIEGEFYIAKNETELDGVELKLFLLMAERLNFTWLIRKPNHFYRYGRRNGSTWNGGMIGQMYRNEIDIAFTAIWLTLDTYTFANATTPWTQVSIRFLVPRPRPISSFWALTRPLSLTVWLALLIMLFVQSIYIWTRAWVDPVDQIPNRFRSFVITWTELMGRLIGTLTSRSMHGLKVQFQLWHMIGVLMVTAYGSSLAASLASSEYEPRIDTTEQFIKANLTWGREGPIPNFALYFDDTDPYARMFPDRFQHENNESERHRKISINKNYAVVGSLVGQTFFPENLIRKDDFKGLRLMKDYTGQYYLSFFVQPWLLDPVDKVMLGLRESGLVRYHLDDVLYRRTFSALRDVKIEHDVNEGGPRVLKLVPLGAGFTLYFVGLFISTIVFYFELKSASRQRTIRETLQEIKNNRHNREIKEREKNEKIHKLRQLKTKKIIFVPKKIVKVDCENLKTLRKFENFTKIANERKLLNLKLLENKS